MGTILPYVGDIKDIPKGWALCDGTNYTPDLTGRFLEGVTANPKSFKEAGIPNITGWFARTWNAYCGGVFYRGSSWGDGGLYAGYNDYEILFDASRCSPVYRNDITTVQPSSYTVYYIMKIK